MNSQYLKEWQKLGFLKSSVFVRKQLLRVEEGQKQKAEVDRICELQLLAGKSNTQGIIFMHAVINFC